MGADVALRREDQGEGNGYRFCQDVSEVLGNRRGCCHRRWVALDVELCISCIVCTRLESVISYLALHGNALDFFDFAALVFAVDFEESDAKESEARSGTRFSSFSLLPPEAPDLLSYLRS